MEIRNSFINSTINKDVDERLVKNGQFIDAENVTTTNDSTVSGGILSNVQGNKKMTNIGVVGAETIGSVSHPYKDKVYNFVTSPTFDYVFEWDKATNTNTIVLQSTAISGVLKFNKSFPINFANVIIGTDDSELLAWTDNSNEPRIVNIQIAKSYNINGFTSQEISVMKPAPLQKPSVVPIISLAQSDANFLAEKFLSFSYRYKYEDGYYSAPSSWSKYTFKPSAFDLDFETFENEGMVNIFNAANISFNTGSRDVIGIDLLFKESNSTDINVIEKIKKSDEGWLDNTTQTIEFNNSKSYAKLSQKEYYRNFDNVPLKTETQDFIGSRLAYANYTEGRDLKDIDNNNVLLGYTVSVDSLDASSTSIPFILASSDYTIEGSAMSKANTLFQINFFGYSFTKDKVVQLIFDLNTVVAPNGFSAYNFAQPFQYIIDKDYTDLNDFYTNSDFVSELSTLFSTFFNSQIPNEVGETARVSTGFVVTKPNSTNIFVQIPAFTLTVSGVTKYKYFIDNGTTISSEELTSGESMKSNRSYEVCMVFEDEQGRMTTGLTSEKNTVHIPISLCDKQNKLRITIPTTQKTPSWAKRYRFGIKENKGKWDEIYTSVFYVDGIYRWVKLDGENKNKVQEGDELIVKRDVVDVKRNVIKTKVLEVKLQESDFIKDNKDSKGNDIIEQGGLYMKISPSGFVMDYAEDEFWYDKSDSGALNDRPFSYIDLGTTYEASAPTVPIDIEINKGSIVTLEFDSNRTNQPSGYFKQTYNAQKDFADFEIFYNEYLSTKQFKADSGEFYDNVSVVRGTLTAGTFFTPSVTGKLYLKVEGLYAGNGTTRKGYLSASTTIRKVSGYSIFEKEYKDLEDQVFYLTPEKYTITNNQYQATSHLLTETFNCFVSDNGAESFKIKDRFNANELALDFTPTSVLLDEYKQINRYSDITYSDGVLQTSTNVNGLNSFNLSTANFKDDIEKSYGPIRLIKHRNTNLLVVQENKWSQVFYGKDLLYNADGSSNLSIIDDVLGNQDTYLGEYGISNNASSFDFYGFNCYATDIKRGVVLRLDNNGLDDISSKGMTSYFKDLFRDNEVLNCIGQYDSMSDEYFLSITTKNSLNVVSTVTWRYSDIFDGWLPRHNFAPENMCRMNNEFVTFKVGELYLHNDSDPNNYNTFYGVRTNSKFAFYFNDQPSFRKNFRTINIEGTDSWETKLTTEFQNGYIDKVDYFNKEGVYRAYIRGDKTQIDTATTSCQGLGNVILKTGNTLTINNTQTVNVGDEIYNDSLVLVGVVASKSPTTILLNTVPSVNVGDFILSAKPQNIETSSLLGYYMKVEMELDKNTISEIFSVSGEIGRSFE